MSQWVFLRSRMMYNSRVYGFIRFFWIYACCLFLSLHLSHTAFPWKCKSVFSQTIKLQNGIFIFMCTFILARIWWLKFYNKIKPVSPTGDFSGQWDEWDMDETHSEFLAYKLWKTKELYSIFEISLPGNIFLKMFPANTKAIPAPFQREMIKILGMRKPVSCSPICPSKLMGMGIRPCCLAPVSSSSALGIKLSDAPVLLLLTANHSAPLKAVRGE